jgi:hypothetical protein
MDIHWSTKYPKHLITESEEDTIEFGESQTFSYIHTTLS